MKTKNERRVVDVSDLIHWQGHLSGIQREVAEMAYRYEKEGAVFCYYEEATQRFYPLGSFEEHMKQRKEAMSAPASVSVANSPSVKQKLKRAGQLVAPPVALKMAKLVRQKVRASQTRELGRDDREEFSFMSGDTLLVFGGHWDKPHYTATLRSIKQQIDIRVAHLVNDLIPVYDKGHVSQEEHVRFPRYIKEISELSDIIYVISEATKRDYERFLRENKIGHRPRIRVIVLGENFSSTGAVKPADFANNERFILAVGTFEVRKNYSLLYYTYKRAHELGVELPKLVIVGRNGWLSGDIHYQIEHDPDIAGRIVMMHNVADDHLEWLYKKCLFTVQPSFSEGWGLPVAEAAYHGKVCASSNTSSLPEVVGDAAVYFSPYSADDCLNALRLLLDDTQREKYEKKVSKRQLASWDSTFHQTKEAL